MARDRELQLIIEAVDDTERAFRSLRTKLQGLQRETRGMSSAFSRMTANLRRSFGSLSKEIFNLRNAIITAFTTGTVAVFTRSVINTGAEIELLKLKLNALGFDGESAFRQLHEWARKLPISTQQAIDMFATLQAYGLKPSIAQMTTLVDTVLALGGGSDTFARIALALGQIASRGKLAAQEMNQLANAGIPIRQILAEGLGVTTQELEDLLAEGIDAQTALNIIFSGLEKRFGGLSDEFANTWKGMIEILKSLWWDFLAAVAEAGVFETFKQKVKAIIDFLNTEAGQIKLKEVAEDTAKAIVTMAEVGVKAAGAMFDAFQALFRAVEGLRWIFDVTGSTLGMIAAQLTGPSQPRSKIQRFGGFGRIPTEEEKRQAEEARRYRQKVFEEWQRDVRRATGRLVEADQAIRDAGQSLAELRNLIESVGEASEREAEKQQRRRKQPVGPPPPLPIEARATGVKFPEEGEEAGEPLGTKFLPKWLFDPEETRKVRDRWTEAANKIKEKNREIAQSIRYIGYTIESSLLNFLDPLSEKFLDLKNLLVNIAREIYREFIRIVLIRPLVSAFTSSIAPAPSRHLGGYIPKFHWGGLARDETLALLKKGEFVLSREAVNALGLATLNSLNRATGGLQGTQAVNTIVIQAMDAQSFSDFLRRNGGALAELMVNSINRNSVIMQSIRRAL